MQSQGKWKRRPSIARNKTLGKPGGVPGFEKVSWMIGMFENFIRLG